MIKVDEDGRVPLAYVAMLGHRGGPGKPKCQPRTRHFHLTLCNTALPFFEAGHKAPAARRPG